MRSSLNGIEERQQQQQQQQHEQDFFLPARGTEAAKQSAGAPPPWKRSARGSWKAVHSEGKKRQRQLEVIGIALTPSSTCPFIWEAPPIALLLATSWFPSCVCG